MKTPSACRILASMVLATSIFSSAKSPDQADAWSVISNITHKRLYTIENLDRKCVWGTITRVTADDLTVNAGTLNSFGSLSTVIFPHADVLRVSSGRIVYYSGRSSWSDISSLRVQGRERLKIVKKGGKGDEGLERRHCAGLLRC